MAAEGKRTAGYEGRYVQGFQYFLEHSGEHNAILQYLEKVLPDEFKRVGAGERQMDVLGVGSGGGELDAQILTLLQSTLPDVSIAADVVEPSTELMGQFKALVSKTPNLKKIPFVWHSVTTEDYKTEASAKGDMKKYDFIHMIQMLYYVDGCAETLKFFHSLLKKNGKLMIIHEQADGGWDNLWKSYKKVLCTKSISDYISSGDIVSHLKGLGLKYEEHPIPNSFDITDCFTEGDETGELLLDFMTDQEHFHQSFTPELRAEILDHLRNKCSSEKDGMRMFDSSLSCIVIYA
ncbi:histamine N-methyltransferase-like [Genypterus blacodes]|uniref:histamine N-methyltransferase-like n=1 Tax=Genypterus blacodes TaxID=154954 RepID=UPI003F759303